MNANLLHSGGLRALAALVALAFAFRLLFLLAMPQVLDTADAIHYVETAAHLARGDFWGYDPKIPVGYPLLCALASFVIPNLEWACRLVAFTASVLTIIPVYGLARDLHGPRAAVLSGVVVALWPWLADYACRVSTESVAVLWWLLAVWLFIRGMQRGGPELFGCVPCFFALVLTRPEGLFIAACTLPAAVILCREEARAGARRYLSFLVPLTLLVLLNTLFVRLQTGATTPSYRAGYIVEEFAFERFVQTGVETFSNVIPVMLGPLLALFLGVGLFHPRAHPRNMQQEAAVLFFATAQWGVSLFVLSPAPRYLMATLVVLSIWSACGIALATGQIAAWRPDRRWLARLPLAAVLLFFVAHTAITLGSEHLGRRPRAPREYKEAGQWMAKNLEPGLIFTRKPQVGFYAGMPSTGPDLDDSLEEALARARTAGAAYVVVDERYTAAMVPALRPLLDVAAAPADLQLLRVFETYPASRVVVYALQTGESADGGPYAP